MKAEAKKLEIKVWAKSPAGERYVRIFKSYAKMNTWLSEHGLVVYKVSQQYKIKSEKDDNNGKQNNTKAI